MRRLLKRLRQALSVPEHPNTLQYVVSETERETVLETLERMRSWS